MYDPSNTVHNFVDADYTLTPPCGYSIISSFDWTGVDATTAITNSNGALTIYTTKKSEAGTYPLKLSNIVTIAANGPANTSTFVPATDGEKVVFTITIVDPCTTATINDVTFSPSNIQVVDGATASTEFTVPTNSVMDTHGDPALLCGKTSFGIYTDTSDTAVPSNWAYITGPVGDTYTVMVDTTRDLTLIGDQSSVTITLKIKSTLDSYTSQTKYTDLVVALSETTCDCSHLLWTNPTPSSNTVIAVGASQAITVPVPTADTS